MFLIHELLLKNSYFGRNMHKNALFLLKSCPALGASPPDYLHPTAGSFVPRPLASDGWISAPRSPPPPTSLPLRNPGHETGLSEMQ